VGAEAAGICVLAWLVTLSVYDIRQRRLPNWLTLPGAVVLLVAAACAGRGTPAVVGAFALCAVYLIAHVITLGALGAGDVKLAIGIGALSGAFGVEVWVLTAIGASLLTAALALLCRSAPNVPHGPSMCVAAAGAVALAVV
jgi:leader peptidase (prepilin peptidase)/N-methyltransferase